MIYVRFEISGIRMRLRANEKVKELNIVEFDHVRCSLLWDEHIMCDLYSIESKQVQNQSRNSPCRTVRTIRTQTIWDAVATRENCSIRAMNMHFYLYIYGHCSSYSHKFYSLAFSTSDAYN